jgi:hypothetical protein
MIYVRIDRGRGVNGENEQKHELNKILNQIQLKFFGQFLKDYILILDSKLTKNFDLFNKIKTI